MKIDIDVDSIQKKEAIGYFDDALAAGNNLDTAKQIALGKMASSLLANGTENAKEKYEEFKAELEEIIKNMNSRSSGR